MKTFSLNYLRILLLSFIMLTGLATANDWPTFMGNSHRAGLATTDISAAKISNLKLDWEYNFNSSVSASPIVVGNQLLVAAENGNLYALDWKTRKLLWIFRTEGGIASTPSVDGGQVYFLSRDGYFYSITLKDAQLTWRFKTGGERKFSAVGAYQMPVAQGPIVDAWDFYLSSPLVHQGKVYFGSSDEHVYALESKTGALIWAFKGDDLFHASPTYHDGKIFIGSMGTRLYALNADTGEKLWDFQGGAERRYSVMLGYVAAASVDKERVYLGGKDAQFHAFNQRDGKLLWSFNLHGSWVIASAAMDDKNVYVTTSDTGLVLGLDKITGKEKFRFETGFWTYASPLVVGQFLLAATMHGEIYGLEKQTGKKIWYYQTPERKADAMDILDDKTGKLRSEKVFAPTRQLQAGVEHIKELGAFLASPIWVDNQLIAITANGKLLVFK